MDTDIEEDYRELFKEWLKDEDCITDKLHKNEMVKRPGMRMTWRVPLRYMNKIQERKVCVIYFC